MYLNCKIENLKHVLDIWIKIQLQAIYNVNHLGVVRSKAFHSWEFDPRGIPLGIDPTGHWSLGALIPGGIDP